MFDPDCYELAAGFLPDDAAESVKNDLAQSIQDTIENLLSVYDTEDEIPRAGDRLPTNT